MTNRGKDIPASRTRRNHMNQALLMEQVAIKKAPIQGHSRTPSLKMQGRHRVGVVSPVSAATTARVTYANITNTHHRSQS